MHSSLFWLTLTLVLTAVLAFPYVLNRIAVRGLAGTMANPSVADLPQAAWAQRAHAAHGNAIENLAVFAPTVLAIEVLGAGNDTVVLACQVYFVARLAHYVVYTLGVPFVRTLAYFAGWGANAVLLVRLLGTLS